MRVVDRLPEGFLQRRRLLLRRSTGRGRRTGSCRESGSRSESCGCHGRAGTEARDIHDAWNGHAAEMETKPTAWSLDVLRDVEWKRFADLCQKFYEASGIRSETTAPGSDAGMDILLYQDDTGKPTAIAQCPGWGERLVGVKARARTARGDDPREDRQGILLDQRPFRRRCEGGGEKQPDHADRRGDAAHDDPEAARGRSEDPAGIRHGRRLQNPDLSELRNQDEACRRQVRVFGFLGVPQLPALSAEARDAARGVPPGSGPLNRRAASRDGHASPADAFAQKRHFG
jgi:hypothetical protein